MVRTATDTNKQRVGLGKKAAEASAAKLAARAAGSDAAAGSDEVEVVAAEPDATPIRIWTSPRRKTKSVTVTQRSVASSRGKKKTADTPSQLVAESQSLLSPPDASSTQGGAPLLSIIHENVQSQITHGTNFPSDKGESSDDDDGVDGIANNMSDEALVNFFDNNENEEEEDVNVEEMVEGLEDLNDYSSDQFSLNERRHYFMDRAAISSQNRAAVEFVYMVEAESLTRDSGTRGLTDVKKLLHSKYIELIRQIPTNHFSEFGLREGMIDKYYGAKKGGASGFYTKVLDVKKKVQAVTRSIDGIGTPLSKIPSGRGLNDVKDQFILDDYKAVMGAVSIVSSSFLWLHTMDANCASRSFLVVLFCIRIL